MFDALVKGLQVEKRVHVHVGLKTGHEIEKLGQKPKLENHWDLDIRNDSMDPYRATSFKQNTSRQHFIQIRPTLFPS
jgi:hypothetical protein